MYDCGPGFSKYVNANGAFSGQYKPRTVIA